MNKKTYTYSMEIHGIEVKQGVCYLVVTIDNCDYQHLMTFTGLTEHYENLLKWCKCYGNEDDSAEETARLMLWLEMIDADAAS